MNDREVAFFKSVAGDRDLPKGRVRELWIIAGRRSGKDSVASLIVAHAAALFDGGGKLRPGEMALCVGLGCGRDQARIVKNYTQGYFKDIPPLAAMITRETKNGIELSNSVEIAVGTNNFRAVRGRPILCAVLDEVAFYQDDDAANPDTEVYAALLPGMATLDGMLIGISSPYAKSGLLYTKYRDHFGKSDNEVLVIKAPTRALNPTIDQGIIDRAMRDDPDAAAAEWMAEFRNDISGLISHEAIMATVIKGRLELLPVASNNYHCFVDAASGTAGGDSFSMAIAHVDELTNKIALDLCREFRPPFLVDNCIAEVVETCRSYGVARVVGDKFSGDFLRQQFLVHELRYEASPRTKSEIYLSALPLINSNRIELLDDERTTKQALALERTVARGTGRETVDHPPGGHDDKFNAAAGAIVLAFDQASRGPITAASIPGTSGPGGTGKTFEAYLAEAKAASNPNASHLDDLHNKLRAKVLGADWKAKLR